VCCRPVCEQPLSAYTVVRPRNITTVPFIHCLLGTARNLKPLPDLAPVHSAHCGLKLVSDKTVYVNGNGRLSDVDGGHLKLSAVVLWEDGCCRRRRPAVDRTPVTLRVSLQGLSETTVS